MKQKNKLHGKSCQMIFSNSTCIQKRAALRLTLEVNMGDFFQSICCKPLFHTHFFFTSVYKILSLSSTAPLLPAGRVDHQFGHQLKNALNVIIWKI